MRNLKLLVLIYFIISITAFPIEFKGEISVERDSKNNIETEFNSSGKLSLDYQEEEMYSQITVSADTNSEEENFDIYRAYTELYKYEWTLTLGRQKIVWGSAFLFNLSDVVNTPYTKDPRKEKVGTDALKLKYAVNDISRIEVVDFSNNSDGDNLAARYTFLINNYEIMLNYFDYKMIYFNKKSEIKTAVLEFKGDLIAGVWSQIAFQKINDKNYNYLVLGSDYSFDVRDRTLYILGESMYNKENKAILFYLKYSYTLSEDMNIGQSYVGDYENRSGILYNNFQYLFNDYVTMEIGINFYNNMAKFSGLNQMTFEEDLKNEVNFKVVSYF